MQPILTDGFLRPKTEQRPAGKQRGVIKAAITALQKTLATAEDDIGFAMLQNVVEQCCNFFLKAGRFPDSYEELQPVPLLSVGLLTYSGDDGPVMGQSYKLTLDQDTGTISLLFRYPDEAGRWQWRTTPTVIPLPDVLRARIKAGTRLAPTLREHRLPDGRSMAVLDFMLQVKKAKLPAMEAVERVLGFDWGIHGLITAVVLTTQHQQISRPWFLQTGGVDGKQARTRRQIDQLKTKQAQLPTDDPKHKNYEKEIARCWRKYEARNQELGHLATNVLLLLASVYGCGIISGESLSTLKTTGRGKGKRGKWRNWRNNTTIRSNIWSILRYKCHLVGIRFRSEHPRGTSHTCPRCAKPANTYKSPRPEHRSKPIDWGRWLICSHCHYSADRDYAAAINIARLGVAYLLQVQQTKKAYAFQMTDPSVKPASYTAAGAMLLLPSPTRKSRPPGGEKIFYPGWTHAVILCSSYPTDVLLQFCGVG